MKQSRSLCFSGLVLLLTCALSSPGRTEALDELIFTHQFGGSGAAPGLFDDPLTLAVDHDNRIIIADRYNHRLQICSMDGQCSVYGSRGDEPGLFNYPGGVAVDSQNRILISEHGNGRVQICSLEGTCEYLADELGEPRQFDHPLDVAAGSNGRIIVTEEYHGGFHICSQRAECTSYSGPSDAFITVDQQDRLLLMTGDRLWICDYDGSCFWALGQFDDPGLLSSATDVTTDSSGRIFIADTGHRRIQICDETGICHAFDLHRASPQLMWWPAGVGLTNDGHLIVSDREGDRIHVYKLIQFEGPAIPVNAAINDAWYDPSTPGQGLFFNVYGNVTQSMFVAWFTYDLERPPVSTPFELGDPGHRWLTAQGIFNTYTATLSIYNTTGPVFLDNSIDPTTSPYGQMTVRFQDCSRGTVTFSLPSVNRSGEFPIRRLTNDSMTFCEQLLQ